MADKGVIFDDLFIPPGVTISIQTFFKANNRISGETVRKEKKLCSNAFI